MLLSGAVFPLAFCLSLPHAYFLSIPLPLCMSVTVRQCLSLSAWLRHFPSISPSVSVFSPTLSVRQSVGQYVLSVRLPVRMIFHKQSICAVDVFREREEREFSVDPVFQRICMELRRNKRDMIIRVPPSFRDDRWR